MKLLTKLLLVIAMICCMCVSIHASNPDSKMVLLYEDSDIRIYDFSNVRYKNHFLIIKSNVDNTWVVTQTILTEDITDE